jgi:outer membrane protein TolC
MFRPSFMAAKPLACFVMVSAAAAAAGCAVGPNFHKPVAPAGGTLLHTKRAADQALLQAAAQYQEAVITAYENVADTLHPMVLDADALAAAAEAERAAKVTLDLTHQRMQDGYTDYLTDLAAGMAYSQAVLSLVQAQATRFGDTAALYQALGGGWWNRNIVVTPGHGSSDEAPPVAATN